ncbi:hypothetical protein T440DRAFT_503348 [Plenodomus tracheiphilus IPT5]|uniref:Uncharacterized protein n=1 Tax=Plenodomus tracheiphilus IPT5 TaxID=1408161 RepID=A0A6A7BMK1_9PLEO|nr:hypothetical protein T440DRAFT_503348 [Plenodomus tracheiphilus IPT5]
MPCRCCTVTMRQRNNALMYPSTSLTPPTGPSSGPEEPNFSLCSIAALSRELHTGVPEAWRPRKANNSITSLNASSALPRQVRVCEMPFSKMHKPTLLHNGRVMTFMLKRPTRVRTYLGEANSDSWEIAGATQVTTDTTNITHDCSQSFEVMDARIRGVCELLVDAQVAFATTDPCTCNVRIPSEPELKVVVPVYSGHVRYSSVVLSKMQLFGRPPSSYSRIRGTNMLPRFERGHPCATLHTNQMYLDRVHPSLERIFVSIHMTRPTSSRRLWVIL